MRKVAIIRRNGLGDLILTCPLLSFIKKEEPESHITLIVDERNAPLIPYLPKIFDRHIVFPKKGNKYLNVLSLGYRCRKEKFDLAISAKTSPMKLMNFLLFATGAAKRRAYVEKKSFSRHLVNEAMFFDHKTFATMHQALKALRLVAGNISSIPEEFYPKLTIPDSIKKKYEVHLEPHPFYFVLTASTTHKSNQINEERYAHLVNRLSLQFPFMVLLIAEKKDEERANEIAKRLKVPYRLIFPRNFDEFMVWLSLGNLYFVPDGGIAHIGAGLGKKGVVLFGSASPEQWAPLSQEIKYFYHKDHVNYISDDQIFDALFLKCQELIVEVNRCKK